MNKEGHNLKKPFFRYFPLFYFIFFSISAQQFGNGRDIGTIESSEITEASGITASRKNPGVFWTHNDSGGKSRVFAFDSLGRDLGFYYIAGIQNRDWEDIAVGPGPIEGEQYLYIADIGDNSLHYDTKYIYRVREPHVSVDQTPIDTVLYKVERLVFQYPDGNRNAETIMIDPLTLDIYIVSKESATKVYRAAWPYTFHAAPTFDVDTLEVVTSFTFDTAVGGDISPDGREILIKKYNVMYYWTRDEDQTIDEAFEADIRTVPYFIEPQGEAVCWASDSSGYYTLSEGSHPHLYFYPRLYPTDVKTENSYPYIFSLKQNYPNPFNPSTKIRYTVPYVKRFSESFNSKNKRIDNSLYNVTLKVYDILGKEVATIVNKRQQPGSYEINFNAFNLPSGVYLYKIQVGEFHDLKKMLLIQ